MAEPTGNEPPNDAAQARRRKKIKPPSDFKSEAEFLTYVRRLYTEDRDADKGNRDPGIEDAEFVAGQHWDRDIEAQRKTRRRPTLTINRMPAFIGQVIGDRRQNETSIVVLPDTDGKKEIALVRQGLIRNIEKISKADRAYDTALQNAVITGIGAFGVRLDYARYDVFDQDINVVEYPDPFSITWDRHSVDKTGRDANHVFIEERMPLDAFKNRYPAASAEGFGMDDQYTDGWFSHEDARIVSFWRMRTRKKTLGLTIDNVTIDITGKEDDETTLSVLQTRPDGEYYMREVDCPYAENWLLSGREILAGPYELEISRVPVFRVPGWEISIGGRRHRFGLVRFLKDPQRLHNYWRSTIAEKLILTPRARWLASAEAVAGREKQWRIAHLNDDPLLIWNGESGQPPTFTPPAQLEPALVQEANMAVQDMRDVSNIHEASLGQQSNEVSGKAILARQRVGDKGTFLYHDNLNDAISELGEVINQLIPVAYDTARTIRVLDEHGKENFTRINDPDDPDSVDIGFGRYSVTIRTGPTTATKRVEAREAMLAVFNAAPETFAAAADLYVQQMDFPGADKFAKRLRKTLPPNLIDPEDLSPEEQQQLAQQQEAAAQEQQRQQQMADAAFQAQLAETAAKVRKAEAEALEAEARARLAQNQARKAAYELDLIEAQAMQARAGAFKQVADGVAAGLQSEAARIVAEYEGDMSDAPPIPYEEPLEGPEGDNE